MDKFTPTTFFEHVSLAAREPAYSAALAWALGESSPLSLQMRISALCELAGLSLNAADFRSIEAATEWSKLDLLLTLIPRQEDGERLYIAIENKIKSGERKGQLSDYDKKLAKLSDYVRRKLFLTLAGDLPKSGIDWQPVAYKDLHKILERARQDCRDLYMKDFCDACGRLVQVVEAVREESENLSPSENSGIVTYAFEGEKRQPENELHNYVRKMKLKGLVQRLWMEELGKKLEISNPWRYAIGNTNGNALLNLEALHSDQLRVRVGLQLQSQTLKLFCHPEPYNANATKEQIDLVGDILGKVRTQVGFDLEPSVPKTRGFQSFSLDKLPSVRLPNGRILDHWRDKLRPWLEKLMRIFPAAVSVEPDAIVVSDG